VIDVRLARTARSSPRSTCGRVRGHEGRVRQPLAQEGAALRGRDRERQHLLDVGDLRPGLREQAHRDRQVDLTLDEQVALERERVDGDRDRALDRVLDGDEPDLARARLDGRDHVGHADDRDPLAGGEIVLGEERLLGEGPRGAEEGDGWHDGAS
jgi:hypothetical protein